MTTLRSAALFLVASFPACIASAQSVPVGTTTELARWGTATDQALPPSVVVNTTLMSGDRVALLVATAQERQLIVRALDGSVRARWDLPADLYPTELAANGDTLSVIIGGYTEARLVTYVVGQRRAVHEQPLAAPQGRNPILRSNGATEGALLWTPETPLARPIPDNYRPQFLVGSDPTTAYGIADVRTRLTYTISPRQDPRQAVLSMLPPWEGNIAVDAWGGDVFFARPVAGIIERFDARGNRVSSITVRSERLKLTAESGATWRDEWVQQLVKTAVFPDSVVAAARTVAVPMVRPLIRALHVASPDDILIVRDDVGDRGVPASSVVVEGINAAGDVTFRTQLPAGATVWDYEGTRLLVRYPDATRRLQVKREAAPQPVHEIAVLQVVRPTQ